MQKITLLAGVIRIRDRMLFLWFNDQTIDHYMLSLVPFVLIGTRGGKRASQMQLKNLSHRRALKFKNRQEWIKIATIASIFVVTIKFMVKKNQTFSFLPVELLLSSFENLLFRFVRKLSVFDLNSLHLSSPADVGGSSWVSDFGADCSWKSCFECSMLHD